MAATAAGRGGSLTPSSSRRLQRETLKGLSFMLVFLALTSSIFLLYYSPSSIKFDNVHESLKPAIVGREELQKVVHSHLSASQEQVSMNKKVLPAEEVAVIRPSISYGYGGDHESPWPERRTESVSYENNNAYHDQALFKQDYNDMSKNFKIYAYPHSKTDPFANVLLPETSSPGGNYASESYFKKSLFKSRFLTDDPSEADLFYLPFSIASLRHDKRVGVGGIQTYVRNYIRNVSRSYTFWNRTGGADHFYVACHSVGRSAMEKVVEVKVNAIQVVCSSSYFLAGYVAHKDASIPQIWPRKGSPPRRPLSQRKNLAFYAGAMNSKVREVLVKTWGNDTEISVHRSRLKTPYAEALLRSKFCIHAKGFEVNTARIGDALYYGCVPVVLADHYDLPYADILDWGSFSVVVSTSDIPNLKKILEGMVGSGEYLRLQGNVMKVQKHFMWHEAPVDYDAFHMVMYELWLRRSRVRIGYYI